LAVTSSTPSLIQWTKIRSLQKSGGTSAARRRRSAASTHTRRRRGRP
jgi:hypothetical protein